MEIISKETYSGFKTVTTIRIIKNEQGKWVATYEAIQARTMDGKEWDERKCIFSDTNNDMQTAVVSVSKAMSDYLSSINGDLFTFIKKEELELKQ